MVAAPNKLNKHGRSEITGKRHDHFRRDWDTRRLKRHETKNAEISERRNCVHNCRGDSRKDLIEHKNIVPGECG